MTVIYDPIPFVKFVQKILVGNYEPIVVFAQSGNFGYFVN